MPDRITVSSLSCHLPHGLGPSAFGLSPPPPCPIELEISIDLAPDVVPRCVDEDEMQGLGVNYSSVSKAIYAAVTVPTRVFNHVAEVIDTAAAVPLALNAVQAVTVRATMPRALLHARAAEYARSFTKSITGTPFHRSGLSCTVRDLKAACVVGLHPHERAERQRLEADITVTGFDEQNWSHKTFADEAHEWLEKSSFGTLESLVDTYARDLLSVPSLNSSMLSPTIDISIRKPSALPFATPSISVTRSARDFVGRRSLATIRPSTLGSSSSSSAIGLRAMSTLTEQSSTSAKSAAPRVYIAVGSNVGDRIGHIRRATRILQESGCTLHNCSRLYESEPMYHEDQDLFINGVIEITTPLPPIELLRLLKRTETAVGRTKTFTNGPRVIDLDLVLYGDEQVKIGSRSDPEDEHGVRWLECPHASLAEREFVLRPLADVAPELRHPSLGANISDLLTRLPGPSSLEPIIPFPWPARPLRLSSPSTPHIMAIFNATPDSFSDGNESRTKVDNALVQCRSITELAFPPAMIDIGGMSTRPNSEPCSESDELDRVVPLVSAIRASEGPLAHAILSVDTYRASVARACIEAGASCINDVRGGSEPGMLATMAEMDVPVVLMHSRGDSRTMLTPEAQDYSAFGGVVDGVRAELADTVRRALNAGVKRWDIILDPGLGFAKSQEDHLRLLKRLPDLVAPGSELAGYPLLVGGSRKGFVGRITGRSAPAERGYGDAALNAWCVTSGVVDIVRVHDPQAAAETVRMAMAIRDVPV